MEKYFCAESGGDAVGATHSCLAPVVGYGYGSISSSLSTSRTPVLTMAISLHHRAKTDKTYRIQRHRPKLFGPIQFATRENTAVSSRARESASMRPIRAIPLKGRKHRPPNKPSQ